MWKFEVRISKSWFFKRSRSSFEKTILPLRASEISSSNFEVIHLESGRAVRSVSIFNGYFTEGGVYANIFENVRDVTL